MESEPVPFVEVAISGRAQKMGHMAAQGTTGSADLGQARPTGVPFRLRRGDRPGPAWLRGVVGGRVPALLAAAVYLAAGVGMWWNAWSTHPSSTMVCDCGDPSSFAWFLAWPAYAISHGQNLFFTNMVHVPGGMNLLDNTSVLALGVILAPVTWVSGPVLSLNVALTAAPVLTALATYASLRRALSVWKPAAFVAGLMFGFSPFVMRNEAVNHLQVSFLALVPLIFWFCYELAVAQRGRWWHWGLGLGILVALQFFVGTEILTITAFTAAIALFFAAFAALSRDALAAKLPYAWRGFLLAAAVAGVLLAYPLWFALAGPQHIQGADWRHPAANGLARVVLPLSQSASQQHHLPMIGYLGPAGTLGAYLGIPAVAILLIAVIAVRRPLAKLCGLMAFVMVWLSLGSSYLPVAKGGEPSWLWLPWRAFDKMPLLDKITPANLSAAVVWFVAVAAALVLDRLRPYSGEPVGGRISRAVRRAPAAWAVAGALGVALTVPWFFSWPLPFTTKTVAVPAWASRSGQHLASNAVVLFYPFPASYEDQALVWQAESGMKYAVVGGRGIVAAADGTADHGLTRGTPAGLMSGLTTSYAPHSYLPLPGSPDPATVASFRRALRHWGVTNVVMTGGGRDPAYARRWLTAVLGTAPVRQNGAWVWNNVQKLPL